jgi:hypothetical protein
MAKNITTWLAIHKNLVLPAAFLCGLILAEAPTLVRQEEPADLTTEQVAGATRQAEPTTIDAAALVAQQAAPASRI